MYFIDDSFSALFENSLARGLYNVNIFRCAQNGSGKFIEYFRGNIPESHAIL